MELSVELEGLLSELVALRPGQAEQVGFELLSHAHETLCAAGAKLDEEIEARYVALSAKLAPAVRYRLAHALESYVWDHNSLSEFDCDFGVAVVAGLRIASQRDPEENTQQLYDICHKAAGAISTFSDITDDHTLPSPWYVEHKWQLIYLESLLEDAWRLRLPADDARSRPSLLAS
jgi:hypothetical protein